MMDEIELMLDRNWPAVFYSLARVCVGVSWRERPGENR